jgi:hypothetical protein
MKPYNINLLIPVHHALNTQKAVAEAIKRAKPWQTSIHLVYLMRSWNPFIMIHPESAFERTLGDDLDAYLKALLNLMHWKELIEKTCPGITVRVHLKKGFSWQSLILHTTQKVGPGTIILASGPKRQWFSIRNFISRRLLALKTGCRICSIKTYALSGFTEKAEILSTASTNKMPGVKYSGFSGFFSKVSFHPLSHN